MAEAFFRRWPLYLLPIVLFIGLGVLQASKIPKKYQSIGVISVSSDTVISDLTDTNSNSNSFETPAVKTARNINERMDSDTFAKSVADGAGLTTAMANGQLTLGDVRSGLSAQAAGDSLLLVTAANQNPEVAQRLASSLITTYTAYVLQAVQTANNAAADFYNQRIADDQVALTKANNALVDWLTQHPAPANGDRNPVEALNLQTLQDAADSAKTQLGDDTAKLSTAQLALASAQSDVAQRLQVTDQPETPVAPLATKLKQIFSVATFALLGLIIVAVALVLAALFDHVVRSTNDIDEACGLDVVASIASRRNDRKPGRRSLVPELTSSAS